MELFRNFLWINIVTVVSIPDLTDGRGVLETSFREFVNFEGRRMNGDCCEKSGWFDWSWGWGDTDTDEECSTECDHTVIICIGNVTHSSSMSDCAYGQKDIISIGGNNISFNSHVGEETNPIRFPFQQWPGEVKIKIDVMDEDRKPILVDHYEYQLNTAPLPETLGAPVKELTLSGRGTKLDVDLRVFCEENYYGTNCGIFCKETNDDTGHYNCDPQTGEKICKTGWMGDACLTNIDDCIGNRCYFGSTCVDGINYYTCDCQPGRTGPTCEAEINECASRPCQNGGQCLDEDNAFICECQPGYTGLFCESEIDECFSYPCENGGICVDEVGSYSCLCPTGFTGNNCQIDEDECAFNPCVQASRCYNVPGDYACQCHSGFTGKDCDVEIDECKSEPCQNGGICIDREDGYTCRCDSGYSGTNCAELVDHCSPNYCRNGATCHSGRTKFTCECPPQFTGALCRIDVDECMDGDTRCSGRGSCTNTHGGYICDCIEGYEGTDCEIETDECESNTEPCFNGGLCIDEIGSFKCECVEGFEGDRCETDINECSSSPCANNALCVDRIAGFVCTCDADYTGIYCEVLVQTESNVITTEMQLTAVAEGSTITQKIKSTSKSVLDMSLTNETVTLSEAIILPNISIFSTTSSFDLKTSTRLHTKTQVTGTTQEHNKTLSLQTIIGKTTTHMSPADGNIISSLTEEAETKFEETTPFPSLETDSLDVYDSTTIKEIDISTEFLDFEDSIFSGEISNQTEAGIEYESSGQIDDSFSGIGDIYETEHGKDSFEDSVDEMDSSFIEMISGELDDSSTPDFVALERKADGDHEDEKLDKSLDYREEIESIEIISGEIIQSGSGDDAVTTIGDIISTASGDDSALIPGSTVSYESGYIFSVIPGESSISESGAATDRLQEESGSSGDVIDMVSKVTTESDDNIPLISGEIMSGESGGGISVILGENIYSGSDNDITSGDIISTSSEASGAEIEMLSGEIEDSFSEMTSGDDGIVSVSLESSVGEDLSREQIMDSSEIKMLGEISSGQLDVRNNLYEDSGEINLGEYGSGDQYFMEMISGDDMFSSHSGESVFETDFDEGYSGLVTKEEADYESSSISGNLKIIILDEGSGLLESLSGDIQIDDVVEDTSSGEGLVSSINGVYLFPEIDTVEETEESDLSGEYIELNGEIESDAYTIDAEVRKEVKYSDYSDYEVIDEPWVPEVPDVDADYLVTVRADKEEDGTGDFQERSGNIKTDISGGGALDHSEEYLISGEYGSGGIESISEKTDILLASGESSGFIHISEGRAEKSWGVESGDFSSGDQTLLIQSVGENIFGDDFSGSEDVTIEGEKEGDSIFVKVYDFEDSFTSSGDMDQTGDVDSVNGLIVTPGVNTSDSTTQASQIEPPGKDSEPKMKTITTRPGTVKHNDLIKIQDTDDFENIFSGDDKDVNEKLFLKQIENDTFLIDTVEGSSTIIDKELQNEFIRVPPEKSVYDGSGSAFELDEITTYQPNINGIEALIDTAFTSSSSIESSGESMDEETKGSGPLEDETDYISISELGSDRSNDESRIDRGVLENETLDSGSGDSIESSGEITTAIDKGFQLEQMTTSKFNETKELAFNVSTIKNPVDMDNSQMKNMSVSIEDTTDGAKHTLFRNKTMATGTTTNAIELSTINSEAQSNITKIKFTFAFTNVTAKISEMSIKPIEYTILDLHQTTPPILEIEKSSKYSPDNYKITTSKYEYRKQLKNLCRHVNPSMIARCYLMNMAPIKRTYPTTKEPRPKLTTVDISKQEADNFITKTANVFLISDSFVKNTTVPFFQRTNAVSVDQSLASSVSSSIDTRSQFIVSTDTSNKGDSYMGKTLQTSFSLNTPIIDTTTISEVLSSTVAVTQPSALISYKSISPSFVFALPISRSSPYNKEEKSENSKSLFTSDDFESSVSISLQSTSTTQPQQAFVQLLSPTSSGYSQPSSDLNSKSVSVEFVSSHQIFFEQLADFSNYDFDITSSISKSYKNLDFSFSQRHLKSSPPSSFVKSNIFLPQYPTSISLAQTSSESIVTTYNEMSLIQSYKTPPPPPPMIIFQPKSGFLIKHQSNIQDSEFKHTDSVQYILKTTSQEDISLHFLQPSEIEYDEISMSSVVNLHRSSTSITELGSIRQTASSDRYNIENILLPSQTLVGDVSRTYETIFENTVGLTEKFTEIPLGFTSSLTFSSTSTEPERGTRYTTESLGESIYHEEQASRPDSLSLSYEQSVISSTTEYSSFIANVLPQGTVRAQVIAPTPTFSPSSEIDIRIIDKTDEITSTKMGTPHASISFDKSSTKIYSSINNYATSKLDRSLSDQMFTSDLSHSYNTKELTSEPSRTLRIPLVTKIDEKTVHSLNARLILKNISSYVAISPTTQLYLSTASANISPLTFSDASSHTEMMQTKQTRTVSVHTSRKDLANYTTSPFPTTRTRYFFFTKVLKTDSNSTWTPLTSHHSIPDNKTSLDDKTTTSKTRSWTEVAKMNVNITSKPKYETQPTSPSYWSTFIEAVTSPVLKDNITQAQTLTSPSMSDIKSYSNTSDYSIGLKSETISGVDFVTVPTNQNATSLISTSMMDSKVKSNATLKFVTESGMKFVSSANGTISISVPMKTSSSILESVIEPKNKYTTPTSNDNDIQSTTPALKTASEKTINENMSGESTQTYVTSTESSLSHSYASTLPRNTEIPKTTQLNYFFFTKILKPPKTQTSEPGVDKTSEMELITTTSTISTKVNLKPNKTTPTKYHLTDKLFENRKAITNTFATKVTTDFLTESATELLIEDGSLLSTETKPDLSTESTSHLSTETTIDLPTETTMISTRATDQLTKTTTGVSTKTPYVHSSEIKSDISTKTTTELITETTTKLSTKVRDEHKKETTTTELPIKTTMGFRAGTTTQIQTKRTNKASTTRPKNDTMTGIPSVNRLNTSNFIIEAKTVTEPPSETVTDIQKSSDNLIEGTSLNYKTTQIDNSTDETSSERVMFHTLQPIIEQLDPILDLIVNTVTDLVTSKGRTGKQVDLNISKSSQTLTPPSISFTTPTSITIEHERNEATSSPPVPISDSKPTSKEVPTLGPETPSNLIETTESIKVASTGSDTIYNPEGTTSDGLESIYIKTPNIQVKVDKKAPTTSETYSTKQTTYYPVTQRFIPATIKRSSIRHTIDLTSNNTYPNPRKEIYEYIHNKNISKGPAKLSLKQITVTVIQGAKSIAEQGKQVLLRTYQRAKNITTSITVTVYKRSRQLFKTALDRVEALWKYCESGINHYIVKPLLNARVFIKAKFESAYKRLEETFARGKLIFDSTVDNVGKEAETYFESLATYYTDVYRQYSTEVRDVWESLKIPDP